MSARGVHGRARRWCAVAAAWLLFAACVGPASSPAASTPTPVTHSSSAPVADASASDASPNDASPARDAVAPPVAESASPSSTESTVTRRDAHGRDEASQPAARDAHTRDAASATSDAASPVSSAGSGDTPKPALANEAELDPDLPLTGDILIQRGEGMLPVLVPRAEELVFEVEVDLGVAGDVTAGSVTLSSGAEPYIEGLPQRGGAPRRSGKEVGWIKSVAEGKHLGYVLHHELYSRHLPTPMPRILYQDSQSGSENRKRKLRIGMQEGSLAALYEHDEHCKGCDNREHFVESAWPWGDPYHCKKCKRAEHRVWKKEVLQRTVPEGTVDMLSAVYLARALVRDGRETLTFPLVDKQKLWNVEFRRGARKRIEVPAGKFDCVELKLITTKPEGEKDDGSRFEGLFGLHGTIQIWFEASTGVPVLIAGSIPVPVVGELDVRVQLKRSKGTPSGFAPAR